MKTKRNKLENFIIYTFFIILCVLIVYPFICILSVSLTSAEEITKVGFAIWPRKIDFSSYQYILKNPVSVVKAYGTTIAVSTVGTLIGTFISALYAYAISRTSFRLHRILSFFAMFTMFFNGGMAAKYIVNVSWLNLKNSFWVLVLPGAFNVMNMIIMKSYYGNLPYSMIESAKIDGASEYTIFGRIMLPLAKPALATVALTLFVQYWNAYYEAMMYMDTGHYVTIQLLLQRMLNQVEFVKAYASSGLLTAEVSNLPGEAMRMAMCALTVIPMVLVFPRFQKYFVKGMAIGAVKE